MSLKKSSVPSFVACFSEASEFSPIKAKHSGKHNNTTFNFWACETTSYILLGANGTSHLSMVEVLKTILCTG